jgi:hypothetical protein
MPVYIRTLTIRPAAKRDSDYPSDIDLSIGTGESKWQRHSAKRQKGKKAKDTVTALSVTRFTAPRRMFQRKWIDMVPSHEHLDQEGDFYLVPNLELIKIVLAKSC